WSTVEAKPEGEVLTDDQLIVFRTHDIGMQHFSSAANQVISESGNERWRIGIGVTRPDVSMLVAEGRRKLSLVVIMYGLAIGFSVFWVLSKHRQRSLKVKAQRLTQSARDYAQELTDLYENAPCGYHSLDELGVIHKINRTELQWLGYSGTSWWANAATGTWLPRKPETPSTKPSRRYWETVTKAQPRSS